MLNQSFLNSITVLYVEDEEVAREKLCKLLSKVFKKIDTAKNGKDGLEKFKVAFENKTPYDLVLSDINMPIMNGVNMLEEIRKIDDEVPFIFTTARSESEHLLKAIELNANHYALKPIDFQNLINKAQAVCEKNYLKKELLLKQKEMENFLNAINHVIGVYIFNEEGKITYINESFLESIEYKHDEIIGKNIEEIFHPEIANSIIPSIWEKTKNNETLDLKIRYKNKNDKAIYFTTAIFKLSGKGNAEYIAIGFENTDDVVQKKEFNKKVMKSFQEFNKKESQYKKSIEEYRAKLLQFQTALIKLQSDLQIEREKNLQKESQLAHYDSTIFATQDQKHNALLQKQKELQSYLKQNKSLKTKNDQLEEKVNILEEQVKKRDAMIESYKDKYNKKIAELKNLEKESKD